MCPSPLRKRLASILLLSSLTTAAVAANAEHEAGLEAASEYRYAKALSHFQAAATQGDREAQRTSGLMLLYGHRLYGHEVATDRAQAVKWLNAAAAGGCQVSAAVLRQLER